jgi:hypothetical protein
MFYTAWRLCRFLSTCENPTALLRPCDLKVLLLRPVWVEADELQAFKAWWDRIAPGERTARRAFLHGLQRSDAAWGVVYRRLGDELQQVRESLRVVDKELVGMRGSNEKLRRELEQAIDRATEAEERVRQLTTPVSRDYE